MRNFGNLVVFEFLSDNSVEIRDHKFLKATATRLKKMLALYFYFILFFFNPYTFYFLSIEFMQFLINYSPTRLLPVHSNSSLYMIVFNIFQNI